MRRRPLRLHDRVCSGSRVEGRFYPDLADKGTVIEIVERSEIEQGLVAVIEWDVGTPGFGTDIDEVGVLDRELPAGTPFMLLGRSRKKKGLQSADAGLIADVPQQPIDRQFEVRQIDRKLRRIKLAERLVAKLVSDNFIDQTGFEDDNG